jgi:hypothetical protein
LLVGIALFILGAMSQSNGTNFLYIFNPAGANECEPTYVFWGGGDPPYSLSVVPGNATTPNAPVLQNVGPQTQTTATWNVDVTAGTSVCLLVTDIVNNYALTTPFTIEAGTSTSCIGQQQNTSSSTTSSPTATQTSSSITSTSSLPSASTSSSSSSLSSRPRMSITVITGVLCGSIAALAVIALIIWLRLRRRRTPIKRNPDFLIDFDTAGVSRPPLAQGQVALVTPFIVPVEPNSTGTQIIGHSEKTSVPSRNTTPPPPPSTGPSSIPIQHQDSGVRGLVPPDTSPSLELPPVYSAD